METPLWETSAWKIFDNHGVIETKCLYEQRFTTTAALQKQKNRISALFRSINMRVMIKHREHEQDVIRESVTELKGMKKTNEDYEKRHLAV